MLFVATQVQSCHGKISVIIHVISTFQMVQFISKQLQQASYIETNNILWLQAIKTREWYTQSTQIRELK